MVTILILTILALGVGVSASAAVIFALSSPRRGERVLNRARRGRLSRLRAMPDGPRVAPRPAQPTVSVVIPALNEAGSIGWVLQHLPSWVSEVVLVDGLSTDATEAIAREVRSDTVFVHQPQRGKGAALRAGFAAATGDIVVMIDADGSTDPHEMHRFVTALKDGADFVKGSRHMANGGSVDFTRVRSAGNRTFVGLANLLYRTRFTDLCYGYCAFWRDQLDALALTADGFEIETQLVLNAVKAGLQIAEVPSVELARRAGTSNLNAFRDGKRVLRTMLGERFGRDGSARAARAAISLVEVQWSPICAEPGPERRDAEHGRSDATASSNTGAERRQAKREQAESAMFVYEVVQAQIAA